MPTYTTNFPATENPISESGKWIGGLTTGLDWHDCHTTPGLALTTQTGNSSVENQFADATANLTGDWGPVQTAQAVVVVGNRGNGAVSEVELRLHSNITAHNCTGYEFTFRNVASGGYGYIVRWNGALGDFTILVQAANYTGLPVGATVKATIDANGLLIGFINAVEIMRVTDTTFPTGNPGIGFDFVGATQNDANWGFSSFTATATTGNGFGTTFATPATPVLNALSVISSSQINLSWTETLSAGGQPVAQLIYNVQRSPSGLSGSYVTIATTAANVFSYSDTGLSASTQYFYQIIAEDTQLHDSAPSAARNATTSAPPPTPAFVQGNFFVAPTATLLSESATFPSSQTSGNCNVAWVTCSNSVTITSVTDTNGHTYSLAAPIFNATSLAANVAIYILNGIQSGANTITATFSAQTWCEIIIAEYSNVASVDASSFAQGTSTAGSSSITTTNAQDTIISFLAVNYGTGPGTITKPSGYIQELTTYPTGSGWIADQHESSILTSIPSWSFSSNVWVVANLALKYGSAPSFNPVSVTFSGTVTTFDMAVMEYSSVLAAKPVDKSATGTGTSTSPSTSALATTSSDTIIGAALSLGGPLASGSNFTQRSLTSHVITEDRSVIPGSYSATASTGSSSNWVIQAVALESSGPSTPTGLIVQNPTSASLDVKWTESSDANYTASLLTYSLKRQAGGGALSVINPSIAGTGTGTVIYTDSGLNPSVLYGYQVEAIDPSGNTSVYTATVSLSTSASSSVGWSEYEIVTAKSTYAATYTLGATGASWVAGIGTWYASVSTIRPTPSSLSSSLTSDRARLRFKFSCLSGSTVPILIAEGPSSIPASSASNNGVRAETVVRPSIGVSGDATSTSADASNLRKIAEKTAVLASSSTSSAPVRLIRKSNPAALSGSLSVSKEAPRVAPLASTPGAISLSSSVEQVETRVVPVVIGSSSSAANAKTTAYFRSFKPVSSGSAGSINPEALSRPIPIAASSSSSNSITTIVEIVLASSPSLSSAHQTLITAPIVMTASASGARSAVELFATGVAPKSLSASNSRSPPRVTSHPNPSYSSSSAANVPPVRYIIRVTINAATTSGSIATAEGGGQIATALSSSNSSVINRLSTRVPLGAISFSSAPLLTVTGSFVTASSVGASSVSSRRLQRPLPIFVSGSSLRTVTEPAKRQAVSVLSASSAASGNHNQLRANNASTSTGALFVLPEFGSTVRIITSPTSLSIASVHLNSVFLVSAMSSSSAVTYTASHLFLTVGAASSGLMIDRPCSRPKPKAVSASSFVTYLPIRFPVSSVSASSTLMIPMVVESINSASNSTGSVISRPCQEEAISAASGSNVIIYAGLVNVMIPISLSSVSVTARVVLRVIPKPTSNSALTASQRAIVRSLPKIVSNSAHNAISRLQGRYLPSAASSSNAIVVSVIASTFRSFPAVYSISAVSPEPVLNIPIILNAISSGQVIMAFVETPRATSLSILNAATRTVQRISAFVSSGSVALYPAVGVLQPKPVLLTASSGNVTSRSAFRPQVACSSSGKAATNSKQFYSARRTTSSSSLSVVVGKIILRPHPISLSSSQATCAKRAEVRVPVNSLSLSKAAKSPEMRVIMRVSVNSLSSSSENAIVEVSFAILAAFYPELSSFTNAMAFTRGLKIFAGGAINSSELEVVVIDDLMD